MLTLANSLKCTNYVNTKDKPTLQNQNSSTRSTRSAGSRQTPVGSSVQSIHRNSTHTRISVLETHEQWNEKIKRKNKKQVIHFYSSLLFGGSSAGIKNIGTLWQTGQRQDHWGRTKVVCVFQSITEVTGCQAELCRLWSVSACVCSVCLCISTLQGPELIE